MKLFNTFKTGNYIKYIRFVKSRGFVFLIFTSIFQFSSALLFHSSPNPLQSIIRSQGILIDEPFSSSEWNQKYWIDDLWDPTEFKNRKIRRDSSNPGKINLSADSEAGKRAKVILSKTAENSLLFEDFLRLALHNIPPPKIPENYSTAS